MAAVQQLLDGGVSVAAADADGRTALHHAATACCVDVALLLLGRGAEVDAADAAGRTALHHAASSGCARVALLLLHAG